MDIMMKSKQQPLADGGCEFSVSMEPDEVGILMRALMRIEAELLIHDADLFTSGQDEVGSAEARQADAFRELVMRVSKALHG